LIAGPTGNALAIVKHIQKTAVTVLGSKEIRKKDLTTDNAEQK
jgi:hypothetical protein